METQAKGTASEKKGSENASERKAVPYLRVASWSLLPSFKAEKGGACKVTL